MAKKEPKNVKALIARHQAKAAGKKPVIPVATLFSRIRKRKNP